MQSLYLATHLAVTLYRGFLDGAGTGGVRGCWERRSLQYRHGQRHTAGPSTFCRSVFLSAHSALSLCVSVSAHCLWVSLPLCLCVSLSAHCRHLCLSVCSLSLCLSQVLSVAMGLSNGGVGPQSVKGLKSASVNGVDLTNSSWNHAWMMPGEAVPTLAVSLSTHCFSVSLSSHCLWVSVYSLSLRLSVYSQAEVWTSSGATKVAWKTATEANSNSSLSWFRTTFDLPTTEADTETETDAPGPAQVSYAMDLSSAQKVRRKLGSLSHFLTPI